MNLQKGCCFINYSHAFLYSQGQMTELGTLGGTSSEAVGLNKAGQVVGYAETSAGERHVFLYSNGQMMDLGPGWVLGINEAGQVLVNNRSRAFLYSNGQMQALGSLPGGKYSAASGINEAG